MPVFFANLTTNSLKEPVLNVRADITELLQPLPCRSIYPVIPVLVSCLKSMSLTACFRDPQRRGYSALEDDSRQNQHNSVTLVSRVFNVIILSDCLADKVLANRFSFYLVVVVVVVAFLWSFFARRV